MAATTLSQPQVQEGLSTMINKASYAVEEFAENTTSLLASAISTIGCGIAEFTGISSAPVLSSPTGLISSFSTTVDSNYNPYLAPWLSSQSATVAYAQAFSEDDAIPDITSKDILRYKPGGYTVYKLIDNNGYVQYIGRTGDVTATIRRHKNNSNRSNLSFVPIHQGLKYTQARGLEQYYIEMYRTLNKDNKTNNQINGVNPQSNDYSDYMDIAEHYLIGETYVGG